MRMLLHMFLSDLVRLIIMDAKNDADLRISRWLFLELERGSEGRIGAEWGVFRGGEHESGPLRVQAGREMALQESYVNN